MMTAFNILSSNIALAAPSPISQTANDFGQGASQLGRSGEMAKHRTLNKAEENEPNHVWE
jgi:hypothetical protein